MDINTILSFITLVIGLVSIFFGIWATRRLAGNLKSSVMFLIIAAIVFIIKEIFEIFNFLSFTTTGLIRNIGSLLIILSILLAVINMKQMIDGIDNHYKKK